MSKPSRRPQREAIKAQQRKKTARESASRFEANLRLLFPQLETLPHADTLFRLLRDIDVDQIEQAHVEPIQRRIRGKKFRRYLINNCYPIAIDGSQKFARDTLWDENLFWQVVDEHGETVTKTARCLPGSPAARWIGATSMNAATSARATAGASRRGSWWKSTRAITTSTPLPWTGTPWKATTT